MKKKKRKAEAKKDRLLRSTKERLGKKRGKGKILLVLLLGGRK